jgi:hypothetical protein
MAGLGKPQRSTGATAGRQLWAVLDGPSRPVKLGCCAASDGGKEPFVNDAAKRTNDRTSWFGQQRDNIKALMM